MLSPKSALALWLAISALSIIGLGIVFPEYGEICSEADKVSPGDCATYSMTSYALIKSFAFLQANNGAITALATGAIAAFTGTLWWSTNKMMKAGTRQMSLMQESINTATTANQIAVANNERQLRAYVTVQEIDVKAHRHHPHIGAVGIIEGAIHTFRFSVLLKNGGLTPAINAKINFSHQRFDNEMSADYHFPDSQCWANALIGPQVIWHTPSITVPFMEVSRPMVGAFHYLYGWIEYDDIFVGTMRHRTEFCFRILYEELNPTGEPWLSFHPHSRFNATDGNCVRPYWPNENRYSVNQP